MALFLDRRIDRRDGPVSTTNDHSRYHASDRCGYCNAGAELVLSELDGECRERVYMDIRLEKDCHEDFIRRYNTGLILETPGAKPVPKRVL